MCLICELVEIIKKENDMKKTNLKKMKTAVATVAVASSVLAQPAMMLSLIHIFIQNIVQRIGVNDYLIDTEENVICKMINQTLLLKESCETGDNILENAFLKS